jgi:hypothetical protein
MKASYVRRVRDCCSVVMGTIVPNALGTVKWTRQIYV